MLKQRRTTNSVVCKSLCIDTSHIPAWVLPIKTPTLTPTLTAKKCFYRKTHVRRWQGTKCYQKRNDNVATNPFQYVFVRQQWDCLIEGHGKKGQVLPKDPVYLESTCIFSSFLLVCLFKFCLYLLLYRIMIYIIKSLIK